MICKLRCLLIVLGSTCCFGCSAWQQTAAKGNSLLQPVDLAADGVQLEIISVRFPLGDELINGIVWKEVNEQQLPLATRRKLAESGFRAGITGCQLPAALSELISNAERQPTKMSEAAARIEIPSAVTRQRMQLHSGWRGEIISSKTYAELPLLVCENNTLCGRSYPQAQCILGARAEAQGDHRLKLNLKPEIQYGEPRQQWVSDDGMLRPQTGKPKRIFEDLAFETVLGKDQMLLITCLPSCPGSLGASFFTEPSAASGPQDQQLQQKLTIVRLAETRLNDLFVQSP
jgi:hypothetical protein